MEVGGNSFYDVVIAFPRSSHFSLEKLDRTIVPLKTIVWTGREGRELSAGSGGNREGGNGRKSENDARTGRGGIGISIGGSR